ncbi:MAG: hypothetical protein ACYCX4_01705 [Bacillota bacterium]
MAAKGVISTVHNEVNVTVGDLMTTVIFQDTIGGTLGENREWIPGVPEEVVEVLLSISRNNDYQPGPDPEQETEDPPEGQNEQQEPDPGSQADDPQTNLNDSSGTDPEPQVDDLGQNDQPGQGSEPQKEDLPINLNDQPGPDPEPQVGGSSVNDVPLPSGGEEDSDSNDKQPSTFDQDLPKRKRRNKAGGK